MPTTESWTQITSFPYTLNGGTNLELTFTSDATVGAYLSQIRSKVGGNVDFQTAILDTAEKSDLDGRLWEIYYSAPERGKTTESTPLSPADAEAFEMWDVSDGMAGVSSGRAVRLIWTGVTVPGRATKLTVTLLCWVVDNAEFSRWQMTINHESGPPIVIDHYEMPILWVRGIAVPNGVESASDGQFRMRVLTPANLITSLPTNYRNSSMRDWTDLPVTTGTPPVLNPGRGTPIYIRHPNPAHPLQFSAFMSANTDVLDTGYLRVLHCGSNDTKGYIKEYAYMGYMWDDSGTDRPHLRWSIRHYPPWYGAIGGGAVGSGSDGVGISVATDYDVMVGSYAASDEHFWWDVCDRYRSEMDSLSFTPVALESSTDLNSLATKNCLTSHYIQLQSFGSVFGRALFEEFFDETKNWLRFLKSAYFEQTPAFLHTQTWNDEYATVNPKNPLNPAPGLKGVAKENLDSHGIRMAGYTEALGMEESDGWSLSTAVKRFNRLGVEEIWSDTTDGRIPDHSADAFRGFWASDVIGQMRKAGFRGIYMDGYCGGSAATSYPIVDDGRTAQSTDLYFSRRVEAAQGFRGAFGDPDGESYLLSESVEEGVSHTLDIAQEGYAHVPGMLKLAEDTIWQAGSPGAVGDMAEGAREMYPPLWEAVWSDRHPRYIQQIPFNNVMLASNGDWNPASGIGGLTANQFIDLYCWHIATLYVTGVHAASLTIQNDFINGWDPGVIATGAGGNQLAKVDKWGNIYTDSTKDPTGAGETVANFWKTTINADARDHGGAFRKLGRLRRPLVVDHGSANNETFTNPANIFDSVTPAWDYLISDANRIWALPGVLAILSFTRASAFQTVVNNDFPVPTVLHSVWSNPDNTDIGLILVNWTRAARVFEGSFNGALHGLGGTFRADRLTLGGSPVSLATGLSGTVNVGNGLIHDVDVGTIAAHSVIVVRFQAE